MSARTAAGMASQRPRRKVFEQKGVPLAADCCELRGECGGDGRGDACR